MSTDPLEGFRGAPGDDDLSPGERLLQRQMANNAGLIKLVHRSETMRRWLDGTPEGQALQDQVELDLSAAMGTWLSAADPCSKECQAAHYNARVAIGIIKKIESIINAGPEAAQFVRNSDAVANAELNNG